MKSVLIVSLAVISVVSNSYENGTLETEPKKANSIEEMIVNKINNEMQANKCRNCISKKHSGSQHESSRSTHAPVKPDTDMKIQNVKTRCTKKGINETCVKLVGSAASLRQLNRHPIEQSGSCQPDGSRSLINGTGHICCNGTPVRASEIQFTDCCGGRTFDRRTHVCCEGVIQKAHGTSNVKGKCCGHMNFYRDCYKCRRPENVLVFKFDVDKKVCCAGRLLKIGGQSSCCNGTIYNTKEYVCLLGILHKANFNIYPESEEQRNEKNDSEIPALRNTTGHDFDLGMLPAPEMESDKGSLSKYIFIAIGTGVGVIVLAIPIIAALVYRRRIERERTYSESNSSNNEHVIATAYCYPGIEEDPADIRNSEKADLIEDHQSRGVMNESAVKGREDTGYTLLQVVPDHSFEGASNTDSNSNNAVDSAYGQCSICSSYATSPRGASQMSPESSIVAMSDTTSTHGNHPIRILPYIDSNQRRHSDTLDGLLNANTLVHIQGNTATISYQEYCGASESNLNGSYQSSLNAVAHTSKRLSTSSISIKMDPEPMEDEALEENVTHFNMDNMNAEESDNFPHSEIRLHLRNNERRENQFTECTDKRKERDTLDADCTSLPETFTKSFNISEKNLTISLFSDSETQTNQEKSLNKRNIFSREWNFYGQFGEKGGTLQQHKDSSVQLIIQPNTVKENTLIDVYGSTYTHIPEMRRKLSIPDDEEIASVGVEYMIPGHPELDQYAVVKMKYTGHPDDLKVYWFKSDEGSFDKTETKPVKAQTKENTENQEMFYTLGDDGFVYVYTIHFSGFVCTRCAKVTHALYPYVFGSCKKSKNGLYQVTLRMHLMTSDVYAIPEYFRDLVEIEKKSSREYRERHEIILVTTDKPQSQLKFRLEVDNEDQWAFKYHPQETSLEVGDVVRCHTSGNARVDWFLESKATVSAYDIDTFGCCIKINEEVAQPAACNPSCIVIPSIEPEACKTVMVKDPLDKRTYAQPVQVSQQLRTAECDRGQAEIIYARPAFEANTCTPVLASDRAHGELARAPTNSADSSVFGPQANIAVKFPVQEKGDVLKTD